MSILTFFVAVLFAVIHIFVRQIRALQVTPRSVWLSFAGGASVAYVFVHLLPELAAHQSTFEGGTEGQSGLLGELETHVYLIALCGLSVFYGLDHLVRAPRRLPACEQQAAGTRVFWLHLGSFAAYNMLIGYLLVHREDTQLRSLILYAAAMGLHFLVNDEGLRRNHGKRYDRTGRWLLAASPLVGYAAGVAVALPELAISSLFAFLAGSIIMNVLKEELPEERASRFSAFAAGALLYTILLLGTR
ncbi:MAG: hypothetical protein ACK4QP_00420 [Pseudorhizobium sp.]